MASTFSISKYVGTSPGTETTGMGYLHLINQDVAANVSTDYRNVSANQITVPASGSVYSYEIYLKGKWSGSYTTISSFKIWRSAGPTNGANGVTIRVGTTGTYTQPVNTSSSVATDSTFPDESGSQAVTVSGSSPNTVSNFIVLQMEVASTANPGDHGDSTYTFKWTES